VSQSISSDVGSIVVPGGAFVVIAFYCVGSSSYGVGAFASSCVGPAYFGDSFATLWPSFQIKAPT